MDPLQELYPFLHGQGKNPQREKAVLLESVRQKSAESRNVKAQFLRHTRRRWFSWPPTARPGKPA